MIFRSLEGLTSACLHWGSYGNVNGKKKSFVFKDKLVAALNQISDLKSMIFCQFWMLGILI